uniref:TERF1-interacting nuclear factor 2 N-terminal domain-containing protein n=1 Tax=Takifugu rubripes TaxID=31033 RepID=A0A3B5KMV7_TAKRU
MSHQPPQPGLVLGKAALLSAAVWQVVQQGLVDHYGMLEEFVTMVTELVPELMSYSQKAQLIMGLRARVSRSMLTLKLMLLKRKKI